MIDTTAKALLATLRNLAPTKVRAYSSDDEYRDIAVPTRRRKWAQVITAIDARSWSRVELLDKSGAVLGYVDNGGEATSIEDIEPAPAAVKVKHDAQWIVELAMRTAREALANRDAETVQLLRAQGDVVREMTTAMHGLVQMYQQQVGAAADLAGTRAAAAAAAAAGDQGGVRELMDALPVIMQALPMLRGLLAGGAPATAPPNGAKKG